MRATYLTLAILSMTLAGCNLSTTTSTSTARLNTMAAEASIDTGYARRAATNTATIRSESGTTGKGVLVARNGQVWLVTADHVFGASDTATATIAGRTVKVTRTHRGPVNQFSLTRTYTGGDLPREADLAIAQVQLTGNYGLPVAEFVRPDVFSHAGRGRISRVFNDRWFMFSMDLNPGFGSSGSGVFCSRTGELMGLYVATTDVSKTGIYVKPQTIAAAIDRAELGTAVALSR